MFFKNYKFVEIECFLPSISGIWKNSVAEKLIVEIYT